MTTRLDRPCSVDRCTDNQWLKGYCQRHYFMVRRHGVPGMPHRRHSVREAIESVLSDPVVTMGKPEWTCEELAMRVNCCQSVAATAVAGLFRSQQLSRRKMHGGYHNAGTYTYRWAQ